MFSLEDNHIIVNYHYVEDPRPDKQGIAPCFVSDFEKQVKFLSENYRIVSVSEVFRTAKENGSEKLCAITFDDGLNDQYDNALPILKKYKAPATFFIITSVFSGRLPTAHKIHNLLSRVPVGQLVDKFNGFLKEFYPDLVENYLIPKDRRLTQKRLHEDLITANFKETMIMAPEDMKGRFLRFGFKTFGLNEKKISKELFMDKDRVRLLQKAGMYIGNHSHHHYALNVINEETLRNDLRLSKDVLLDILGEQPKVFSYPHGRSNDAARKILQEEGIEYAVTIDKRAIEKNDEPLLIPRYDTNDIKRLAS